MSAERQRRTLSAVPLVEQLRAIVAPLPPGSAVSLPVDWLRAQLDSGASDGAGDGEAEDFTLEEVAERVKRSPSTVRTWCAGGLLPGAYKLRGRDWRIPRVSLRSFLNDEAGSRRKRITQHTDAAPPLGAWRGHVRPR